jgi:sec-independent protein translocase protein TatA
MTQPIFANLGAIDTPAVFIIAAVALLLFGGSKLANFGKSLGEGLKEFKNAVKDETAEKPSEAVQAPVASSAISATVAAAPVETAPKSSVEQPKRE